MLGELQPMLAPRWEHNEDGVLVPMVRDDEKAGPLQHYYPLETRHQLVWPADDTVSAISKRSWFSMSKAWPDSVNPVSGEIWFVGTDFKAKPDKPIYLHHDTFTLRQDVRAYWSCPEGTDKVTIRLDPHWFPVGWCWEVEAN